MENPEAIDSAMVHAFVGYAHSDLLRVKELLEQEPALLNASWDWGGGDWETALGAASHMGRKDIALFLLENGARLDIFAAAMLGKVAIVDSILTAFPEARHAKGPHGITLQAHALAGGEDGVAILELLED